MSRQSNLEWHYVDYPTTGLDDVNNLEYHWSDLLLIKVVNEDEPRLAYYNEEKEEWWSDDGEKIPYNHVVCWASYGRIPESNTPMSRKSGKV